MFSGWMFIIAIISILVGILWWQFRSVKKIIEFFKTKPGEVKGMVLFILFGLIFVLGSFLFSCEAKADELKYFQYGYVYLGVDYTKRTSPQCEQGDNSDRLTSNGGLVFNILQSRDERFMLDAKYTHHSCVFNGDRFDYDAGGVYTAYRFW